MSSAGSGRPRTRPSQRSTHNGRSAPDATPGAQRTGSVALIESARPDGLPSALTALTDAVLSALPVSIAVLDRTGAIVAVNESWKRFARENGDSFLAEWSVGLNYLDVCRQAAGPSSEESREVAEGIQAVLEGSRSRATLDCPCHSPTERRWLVLNVEPLPDGQGAVVFHTNVSERKPAEPAELAGTHVRRRIKASRPVATADTAGVDLTLGEVQVQVSAADLIELTPDVMVLSNSGGEIVLVNRKAEAVFGYTHGSLLGASIEGLLPTRFHEMYAQHRRRFFTEPAYRLMGSRLEVCGRRRDGSEFPVEITLSLLVTTAGTFALSAIRDLTERKRLEAAEHERACTLEATIEAMIDGVCIYDPAGRIMRMNAAARAMLGLEQPPSHDPHDPYDPHDPPEGLVARMHLYDEKGQPLPAHAWPHIRVLLSGETLTGTDAQDVMLRSLDGREWRLSATAAPVRDREERIIAVVVVMRDVTRRWQLERELAKRMSQIEGIFETAADGIALYDEQGHIIRANQALIDLAAVDRNPDYFAGLPAERTKLLHLYDPATGRLLSVEERPISRALRGEVLAGATAEDVRMHALDGRQVDVSVSAAPLRDEAGRITGAVVVMRDVTERRRLERELADRAGQMQAIFDAMVDGLILFDTTGRVITANPALLQLVGFQAIRGINHVSDSMSQEQRHTVFDLRDTQGRPIPVGNDPMQRLLRGETLTGADVAEVQLRTLDGRQVEISVSGAPVRDQAGQVIGAAATVRDVTERRRLERDAAERASLIECIFDTMADGIALCDGEGRLLATNRILRTIIGREHYADFATLSPAARAELLHARDADGRLMSPSGLPDVRALGGETLKDNSAMDLRVRMGDGSDAELNVTAAPVRDPAGRITGAVTVWRDVTARRQLERELATRMSQIEGIFETAADGIALCDEQGRFVRANQAFASILALDRDPCFYASFPEERARLLQVREPATNRPLSSDERPISRALRGEVLAGATAVDERIRALDGRDVDISVSAAPLRDEAGRVTGAVVVMRDVTERRELERERALIMNTVSHELKTPLNIMRMGGELIRRYAERHTPPEMETLMETVEVVNSATSLMRRLVNDLVDVARMEMGHLTLSLAPTDLADLARRVAQDHRGLTGRSINVEAPKHLVVASGDAMRIIQVLTNLISNAFKYSPADSPVRLRLRRAHRQARFEVRDEGPGIPREFQTRIFERFYQSPGITVQQGSGVGLGLGLYICRQLVELHGGHIDVTSEVGQGSTFWFTLPLARADA